MHIVHMSSVLARSTAALPSHKVVCACAYQELPHANVRSIQEGGCRGIGMSLLKSLGRKILSQGC